MDESEVIIRLTPAEAAVLDDLLRRYSMTDRFDVEQGAEQQALWNLACLLERHGDRPGWPPLAEARRILARSPESSADS